MDFITGITQRRKNMRWNKKSFIQTWTYTMVKNDPFWWSETKSTELNIIILYTRQKEKKNMYSKFRAILYGDVLLNVCNIKRYVTVLLYGKQVLSCDKYLLLPHTLI